MFIQILYEGMGLNSQLAIHSDKKLSCYITFKQNFGQEKYLRLLKKFEQRRSFTRFRISAQRLNIERRRYVGIPRQEDTVLDAIRGVASTK